ncbi:unnamed protein product [Blepharisma stoltei]|uniref:Uncharacterized protein n=1 Tax=Blepharisma stoltei TaxID=1481888 RepID=A0AAU9JMQ6_9CILI|nr:unnamed protein product [Blepharisma stoltei]
MTLAAWPEMIDSSSTIKNKSKTSLEERASDRIPIGEFSTEEEISTEEVLYEDITENSDSDLEELIYFEDSSATRASEIDGL